MHVIDGSLETTIFDVFAMFLVQLLREQSTRITERFSYCILYTSIKSMSY